MRRPTCFLLLISSVTLIVAAGCGTSGSNPTLYSEVLFQVAPKNNVGQATFSVEVCDDQTGSTTPGLVADGVRFGFPANTTFTTTAPFSFYLEGAAPPYCGTFKSQDGTPITVSVYRNRALVQTNTSMGGEPVTVRALEKGTPTSAPPTTQLVRFDVCAPVASSGSCSTTGDAGAPGIVYSGNLGDPITSHELLFDSQLPRTTPAIYFLQDARDNASAVFQSGSHQLLQAQLFVNNTLEQTSSGTSDDVVIDFDL